MRIASAIFMVGFTVGAFERSLLDGCTYRSRMVDNDPLESHPRLRYHAVPDNMRRLNQFVTEVTKLWLRQLRRRSQRGRAAWPWSRMQRLVKRYLPRPKIQHPDPKDRFHARLAARAVWGSASRTDLCGGPPVTAVPTAIPEGPPTFISMAEREPTC